MKSHNQQLRETKKVSEKKHLKYQWGVENANHSQRIVEKAKKYNRNTALAGTHSANANLAGYMAANTLPSLPSYQTMRGINMAEGALAERHSRKAKIALHHVMGSVKSLQKAGMGMSMEAAEAIKGMTKKNGK